MNTRGIALSIEPDRWCMLFHWALIYAPIDVPAYRVVLAILVARVDSTETCFPSKNYIADKAGIGRDKTYEAINALNQKDLISSKARGRPGKRGGQTTQIYRLKLLGDVPIESELPTGKLNSLFRWALIDTPIHNFAQRLVLSVLVTYVDSTLTCSISTDEIREITRLSLLQIRNAIRALRLAKLIEREQKGIQGQCGGQGTPIYRLLVDRNLFNSR